jgi:plastocyanin
MKASRFVRTGLALALALGAAACSGGGDSPYGDGPTGPKNPGTSSPSEIHLTSDRKFTPGTLAVAVGTRVRWINDANISHTITPEDPNQKGAWTKQTTSASGTVFEHTFSEAGQTYSYRCDLHSGMTGTVQVSSSNPGY